MAQVIVSEYVRMASFGVTPLQAPAPQEPPVVEQSVDTSISATSEPFAAATRFVRLQSDEKVHFLFGGSPTATAENKWLSPDVEQYYGVVPGQRVNFLPGV